MAQLVLRSSLGIDPLCPFGNWQINPELLRIPTAKLICQPCVIPKMIDQGYCCCPNGFQVTIPSFFCSVNNPVTGDTLTFNTIAQTEALQFQYIEDSSGQPCYWPGGGIGANVTAGTPGWTANHLNFIDELFSWALPYGSLTFTISIGGVANWTGGSESSVQWSATYQTDRSNGKDFSCAGGKYVLVSTSNTATAGGGATAAAITATMTNNWPLSLNFVGIPQNAGVPPSSKLQNNQCYEYYGGWD